MYFAWVSEITLYQIQCYVQQKFNTKKKLIADRFGTKLYFGPNIISCSDRSAVLQIYIFSKTASRKNCYFLLQIMYITLLWQVAICGAWVDVNFQFSNWQCTELSVTCTMYILRTYPFNNNPTTNCISINNHLTSNCISINLHHYSDSGIILTKLFPYMYITNLYKLTQCVN